MYDKDSSSMRKPGNRVGMKKILSPKYMGGLKVLFGIWICLLSGCNSEWDDITPVSNNGYLQLDLSMPVTRATFDEEGTGTFTEGDRVGLYIDNGEELYYQELTFEGGEWLPRLKRQEFGSGRLTLSAHYPVVPGVSDIAAYQCDFKVATDQTGTGRNASDLLLSQAVLEKDNYHAGLVFRHALHRLRIELSSPVEEVGIAVRSRTRGVVDLLTGETVLSDETFEWITPAKNVDGSFEAVIFPQSAAPFRDGDGSLLQIAVQDKTYDFKAPETLSDGKALEMFEAGRQVTVKLSLKESGEPIDSEWANRKVWVYGINAPEESDWKRFFSFYNTDFLPWKQAYGWYDCNKMNPSALPNGIPDGMMCWAATASNMLHWWFAQNKTYIDLYKDHYKGPDPEFHHEKQNTQESDIFQCFIDSFADDAGYSDAGVNWFIHGIIPSFPSRDYPYNDGGYFKDVFPQGVTLGSNVGGLGKEVFNNTIKDALSGKKALGISIGPVRKSHLVTVWGAEFDENGDVSYIYVADNNDRDDYIYFGIGCARYQIVYERYIEGATYTAYKEGYIPYDPPITINRIVTLDLGEKYWKQYFTERMIDITKQQ